MSRIAWLITDLELYDFSESSVHRCSSGLIVHATASEVITPALEVVTAADTFGTPTQQVNELWQTDFTYIKIRVCGWYDFSTVQDDNSRDILAWKLTPSVAASDVLDTLEPALKASGLKHA